jgi:hypothetical protein
MKGHIDNQWDLVISNLPPNETIRPYPPPHLIRRVLLPKSPRGVVGRFMWYIVMGVIMFILLYQRVEPRW